MLLRDWFRVVVLSVCCFVGEACCCDALVLLCSFGMGLLVLWYGIVSLSLLLMRVCVVVVLG